MSSARRVLGDAGERHTERMLTQNGWTLLDRKWRGSAGEVDLVALDGEVLVFIEVKTRRGGSFGTAEEAVDAAKAERLLELGDEYIQAHEEHADRTWRVDIVAITLGRNGAIDRLTHMVNACEDS